MPDYELVIRNGRVIDPETKMDAVRNIGVTDGVIKIVTDHAIAGVDEVDASGLVVCPGFIDTHSHGQDPTSSMYQACDGVTTALELEFGAWPVPAFYLHREGRARINYGASVGHIPARIAAQKGDLAAAACSIDPHLLAQCCCTSEPGHLSELTPPQYELLLEKLRIGVQAHGGLGVGMGIAYVGACDHEEVFRVFKQVAALDTVVYVHNRGEMNDLGDFHEMFADVAASGARFVGGLGSLFPGAVASSSGRSVKNFTLLLEMLDAVNERGLDISAEAYPYTAEPHALSPTVPSGLLTSQLGRRSTQGDVEWSATGERLSAEVWDSKQAEGGNVIIHSIPEEVVEASMRHPRVIIASDAIPFKDGKSHPRAAGCFSRKAAELASIRRVFDTMYCVFLHDRSSDTQVLACYVRDQAVLSLELAIAKMTLMPANRVAQAGCSHMLKKGRVQVGCDADITIFDPDKVQDRATFAHPAVASGGIEHVIVNGTFVVRHGEFIPDAFPGRAVRGDGAFRCTAAN